MERFGSRLMPRSGIRQRYASDRYVMTDVGIERMGMRSQLAGDPLGLALVKSSVSRSINAENPRGEKGRGAMSAGELGPGRKGSPCIRNLEPGSSVVLADIEGTGVINHLWFTVADRTSDADRYVLRDLVLRIYWDDEQTPSVECPLGDFFCCGFGQVCRVNSLPIQVVPTGGMNAYFPMPFGRHARLVLENQHVNIVPALFYQIDYSLQDDPLPASTGYFHAQWRRQKVTVPGQDYVVLDGVRGRGQYIGTYLALSVLERYWWGEGEFKFYIDGDEAYPTICSTGTEDYFGGAWSFAVPSAEGTSEQTYCAPFCGYPFYSNHDYSIRNRYHNDDCPPMRGLYRWHIPDPIRFEQDLRVTWQQIGSGFQGAFERSDDVSTVAYWYQLEPHGAFPALPLARDRWPR